MACCSLQHSNYAAPSDEYYGAELPAKEVYRPVSDYFDHLLSLYRDHPAVIGRPVNGIPRLDIERIEEETGLTKLFGGWVFLYANTQQLQQIMNGPEFQSVGNDKGF
jgi:hypothetical protein